MNQCMVMFPASADHMKKKPGDSLRCSKRLVSLETLFKQPKRRPSSKGDRMDSSSG